MLSNLSKLTKLVSAAARNESKQSDFKIILWITIQYVLYIISFDFLMSQILQFPVII